MSLRSALYEGVVTHRRFGPIPHRFAYRHFMVYLDLAELPRVFAGRWLWAVERRALASFRRADHLGDSTTPLDDAVRDLVASRLGRRPSGPIRLLTQLRHFGYAFNPVSFYFCFDAEDRRVDVVVAEVNNTPWGEQHCYVLPVDPRGAPVRAPKQLHVSPFLPMKLDHEFTFGTPGERLRVTIRDFFEQRPAFTAHLALERREIDGRSLARALLRFPLASARVILAIYTQALRLWWKGAPFHPHPAGGGAGATVS